MFVIGNFFIALSRLVDILLFLYSWVLLIRVLASWLNADPFNPIVQFLQRATDPILDPIRRVVPPMGLDFSPMIAWLLIKLLSIWLVPTIATIGMRLQ